MNGWRIGVQFEHASADASVVTFRQSDPAPVALEHPRGLSWLGTTALAVGGSNQSLFLVGALVLAQGSAAIPLLIVGLLLSWAAAFGWTELVLMSPNRVGGIAAACSRAFRPYSPVLANLTGVCYWWGWVPTCGLTAILSASAIHQWYLPGIPVQALATGLVVAFAALNLCGIRWVSRVAIPFACVAAGLALLSAIVPVIAGTVDWHRAASFELKSPFQGTFGALTSAMAGLYLIGFAAPAFEAAACHVGETRDPARNVPRAMFASGALASVYFLVLPLIWLGAIGSHGLEGDLTGTLGPTFAPLLGGMGKAAAIWFMVFNMFHGTLQPLAGASRTLAQLSEDGLLPRFLAWRSRTDTPWAATLLTAGVSIAFLLTGDPISLIAAANFTYLIGICLPSIAVWLLRRNEPGLERPYRAPRGTIVLGLVAASAWAAATVLGFEQFGLPTVMIGLSFAYAGSLFYAWRVWSDRRQRGLSGGFRSLHLKLTGAMVGVIALDGVGYLIAVSHLPNRDMALVTVLEDIFVAVALLTITVGLVVPGMIANAAHEVAAAAARLGRGTITDLATAMDALRRGDLDAAHVRPDTTPVAVHSNDELGSMAASFNEMQAKLAGAAEALDGAREGLRSTAGRLQRNIAQQAAVVKIGQRALAAVALGQLMEEAAETVAEVLGADLAAVFELQPDSERLLLRSSAGLPTTATQPHFASGEGQARYTLTVGASVIVDDWATEDRFEISRVLLELGAQSGVSVPIQGSTRAYGVLAAQSRQRLAFGSDEVDFLRAVANVLARAVDRTRAEEATQHAALHDALTGLPNRVLFADRLEVALAQARRTDTRVAVLFLDLDNFKMINDSYGHDVGDELLTVVAGRLTETLRMGHTVARFGGDEFVIVCVDMDDVADAITVTERLQGALLEPIHLAGTEQLVSASVGIAVSDGLRQHAGDLIRDADAAMYRAKELGNGRYELSDQEMRDELVARVRLGDELRHVIDRDELRLHYQPIVSLRTGGILGVEALVRWQHPERGLVPPGDFIPAAEQTGVITAIGLWVLTEACRQMSAWNRLGGPDESKLAPLFVAVNVSARQIEDQTLPATIERLLDEHDLLASQLHLEITESALLQDAGESLVVLERLRDIGVDLVLDDFGTGYSSLSYVKRFPIQVLKIDRSFISDLGDTGDGDTAIVEAIISMARALGVGVIAEGVETRAQANVLLALHCDWVQGWLHAPALPPAELMRLLSEGALQPPGRSLALPRD
jgi:diguanylate cyclase (GGDEF)-like protein